MINKYKHPFIRNPMPITHNPVQRLPRKIIHGVPTPPPGGWHGPIIPKSIEKFPTPIWHEKLPTPKIWHGLPNPIINPIGPIGKNPVWHPMRTISPPPGGGNKTQSNPDESGAMGAVIGAVVSVLPFLL